MRRLLICILLTLLFCAPFASAEGVNRLLLIGCDRFLTEADTSPAAENNVRRMTEALSGGCMNPESVYTQRHGIPDASSLLALTQEAFQGADAEDTSWLYLSTHGKLNAGGAGELILSDGTRESALTARELKAILDTVPGHKVLILDACQSGAMLGKGLANPEENIFSGDDYTVICSAGGAEASWLWTEAGAEAMGQGYFSGILADALSARGGFSADENGDGNITLTELHRYMLQHCGESTVQTYPEESDRVVFSYSPEGYTGRTTVLDHICFEDGVLDSREPEINLSFTLRQTAQISYRIIYLRNGVWDFEHPESFRDDGSMNGQLLPGFYQRTICLNADQVNGYALIQLICVTDGEAQVAASHILCVPPESGDPLLQISVPKSFDGEMNFTVYHALPCALTVTVETPEGETIRRLCTRLATRPQQISGTSLIWSGLDNEGSPAAKGNYLLRVKAYIGDEVYEQVSGWIDRQ